MEMINNWIVMTILSAFFNAIWTSLTSKKDEGLSNAQFTILFRTMTVVFLLPFFVFKFKLEYINYSFLFFAFLYAVIEGLRTNFIVKGAQEDYYAMYAFVNMSPIFTVLFAPLIMFGQATERWNIILFLGTFFTILGGFLFYRVGKFSKWGLIVAIIGGIGVLVSKLGVDESNGIAFSVVSFTMLSLLFSIVDYTKSKKIIVFEMHKNMKTVFWPAFFSAIATAAYFIALETGAATKVSNLLRSNLIFGFLVSYFVLKEIKDWKMKLLGGAFVILGGVVASYA